VGKSSLLNAIAGYDRVIVTDIPGTTRDTVEETVMLGKTKLRLIDTAGIRETSDTVEAIGVERSKKAVENADLVIFVCDGSTALTEEDRAIMQLCKNHQKAIGILNKADLGCAVSAGELPFDTVISICAKEGRGLETLSDTIDKLFVGETPCDGSILTNTRQADACRRAYDAMSRSIDGLNMGLTPDAVLTDVEEAMEAMGEVTGATVREDITARIFERFCVGK
jgi:tRNA modification GTPase